MRGVNCLQSIVWTKKISPLLLPATARTRFSFPALNPDTFRGLPGVIADALPDKFGNALIDEYMARNGIRPAAITTLQRLIYIGRRGMGALEFAPPLREEDSSCHLQRRGGSRQAPASPAAHAP